MKRSWNVIPSFALGCSLCVAKLHKLSDALEAGAAWLLVAFRHFSAWGLLWVAIGVRAIAKCGRGNVVAMSRGMDSQSVSRWCRPDSQIVLNSMM